MLHCLQTAQHHQEEVRLAGSASVMELFQQVPLRFSGQVGREEAESEVRLSIERLPARYRPHVYR